MKKVLIAEDEAALRDILSAWLGRQGYVVETAEDGVEACEKVEASPPDLVLLDLMLPRRDGYTVLFHIRSLEATRATPVLFMSAEPARGHDEIARTLGAQGFVAKPFRLDALLAAVEAALAAPAGVQP